VSKPSDLPRAPVFSASEKDVIRIFKDFTEQMRKSDIHTVLDTELKLPKPGELSGSFKPKDKAVPKAEFENPFEAMHIYSSKDIQPKLALPKLDGRGYGKLLVLHKL
jgi:hypothetical protein